MPCAVSPCASNYFGDWRATSGGGCHGTMYVFHVERLGEAMYVFMWGIWGKPVCCGSSAVMCVFMWSAWGRLCTFSCVASGRSPCAVDRALGLVCCFMEPCVPCSSSQVLLDVRIRQESAVCPGDLMGVGFRAILFVSSEAWISPEDCVS